MLHQPTVDRVGGGVVVHGSLELPGLFVGDPSVVEGGGQARAQVEPPMLLHELLETVDRLVVERDGDRLVADHLEGHAQAAPGVSLDGSVAEARGGPAGEVRMRERRVAPLVTTHRPDLGDDRVYTVDRQQEWLVREHLGQCRLNRSGSSPPTPGPGPPRTAASNYRATWSSDGWAGNDIGPSSG